MNEQVVNSKDSEYVLNKFNSITNKIEDIKKTLLEFEVLKNIDICYEQPENIETNIVYIENSVTYIKDIFNKYIDEIFYVDSVTKQSVDEIEIPTGFETNVKVPDFGTDLDIKLKEKESSTPVKEKITKPEAKPTPKKATPVEHKEVVESSEEKIKEETQEETKMLADNIKHILEKIKIKRKTKEIIFDNKKIDLSTGKNNINKITRVFDNIYNQFIESNPNIWKGETK